MPFQSPLMVELARIEQDAAEKTQQLLDNQDAFFRGHALVDLLKAHGAPDETSLNVVFYGTTERPGFIIYADNIRDNPEAVFHAIQDSRAPYQIGAGYSDDVRRLRVEGYEGVEIALPAALFPTLKLVEQAAS